MAGGELRQMSGAGHIVYTKSASSRSIRVRACIRRRTQRSSRLKIAPLRASLLPAPLPLLLESLEEMGLNSWEIIKGLLSEVLHNTTKTLW